MPAIEENRRRLALSIKPSAFPSAVSSSDSRSDEFFRRHGGQIAAVLCVYAALRILVFIAAFPLFNNVDEKCHFLSIRMYANGLLPGKALPLIDGDFSTTYLPYFSPEYGRTWEAMERERTTVPIFRLSPELKEDALTQGYYSWKLAQWSRTPNYEAQGAPLYYIVGAGWYRLGMILGLRSWGLVYWLRFLNPFAYGIFVWTAYKLVRRVYPDRPFLFTGVPALLAVFPNDVFYGMNRDVLSPALCTFILLLMIESIAEEKHSGWTLLLASLLVGLGFVLEVSNCIFYGVLAATLWRWMRRPEVPRGRKVMIGSLSTALSLVFPLVWMVRNYLVVGDLTGSRAKLQWFGWTVKPLREMVHHPLFTRGGLVYFLVNLVRDSWQGEIRWWGDPMRWDVADKFYIFSTGLFIVVFAVDFMRNRTVLSSVQKWIRTQFVLLIAAGVAFLAAISLPFDYHDFGYPSQVHPFFVSGRIICGVLVPFAVVYLSGMELVSSLSRRWVPPIAVLACLLLFVTASEIRVRSVVFRSPYNFFALTQNIHYRSLSRPVAARARSDQAR